jgi:hypothetical protein
MNAIDLNQMAGGSQDNPTRPSALKSSQWIPALAAPHTPDVYEVKDSKAVGTCFSYFDGEKWAWPCRDPETAYAMRGRLDHSWVFKEWCQIRSGASTAALSSLN